MIARIQAHIDALERGLAQLDPQRVMAVPVPGYAEPAERVVSAGPAPAPLTAAQIAEIRAGTREPPDMTGPSPTAIRQMKRRIVHHRAMLARHAYSERVKAQAASAPLLHHKMA